MTLDEFLDARPDVVNADHRDQFFAVAWFFLRHESQSRFTLNEMMDRMKAAGLDNWEVTRLAVHFCGRQDLALINTVENMVHYYALTRSVKDALDSKYGDTLKTPTAIAASNAFADLPKLHSCLVSLDTITARNSNRR